MDAYDGAEAEILTRFIASAGGGSARIHLIATAYDDVQTAQAYLELYRRALHALAPNLSIEMTAVHDAPFTADATPDGALIIAQNPTILDASDLGLLREWHIAGVPMLFDGEAIALAGAYFVAMDLDASPPFMVGEAPLASGLGLLPIGLEASMMTGNRYGRWVSLAYQHPDSLAVGIPHDAALFISHTERRVLGLNSLLVLDLSRATLAQGANDVMVIANGVLDTWTAGDTLPSASQ